MDRDRRCGVADRCLFSSLGLVSGFAKGFHRILFRKKHLWKARARIYGVGDASGGLFPDTQGLGKKMEFIYRWIDRGICHQIIYPIFRMLQWYLP